jgi:chromosome segregation ATPase
MRCWNRSESGPRPLAACALGSTRVRRNRPGSLVLFLLLALVPPAVAQMNLSQPSTVASAIQQLSAARAQLKGAQAELNGLTEQYQAKLSTEDPAFAQLRLAVAAAARHREELRESLTIAMRQSMAYQQAKASLDQAEAEMQKLTEARDTASRRFEQVANQAFEMRQKLRELEHTGLTNSSELQATESGLEQAQKSVSERWEQYVSQSLGSKPAWLEALHRRDQAAEAVRQAEAAVANLYSQTVMPQARAPMASRTRASSYSPSSHSSHSSRSHSR